MAKLFSEEGKWLKGNLHMHTTKSDGSLSPQDAINIYKNAGYDFIALTDHWVESDSLEYDDFLVLPGCEFNVGEIAKQGIYHIVGVFMESSVKLKRSVSLHPQEIIDEINKASGLAILAHPAWSITNPSDCFTLNGLCGAEIYNTFSGLPWNCRPDSSIYFDIWATNGKIVNCMAADDCHFYKGEETKSFIMVKAKDLTPKSLKKAILKGDFYSSQGPEFNDIEIDNGAINVSCSEVEKVIFYSNTVWSHNRVVLGGVTNATYKIEKTDTYVRIELVDYNGKRAWSSPFFV
jgi:hypothetical protein